MSSEHSCGFGRRLGAWRTAVEFGAVGSIAGLRGGCLAGNAAYAASKGAVITVMKSAARELGPRGIAVNAVAPGVIDTPLVGAPLADPALRRRIEEMTGLGRLGTAKSWHCQRRVAARIEATTKGLDIRCVVTNLSGGSAEWLYNTSYCARGHAGI